MENMGWFKEKSEDRTEDRKPETDEQIAQRSSVFLTNDLATAEKRAEEIEEDAIKLAGEKTPAELTEVFLSSLTAKVMQAPSVETAEALAAVISIMIANMPASTLFERAQEAGVKVPLGDKEDGEAGQL